MSADEEKAKRYMEAKRRRMAFLDKEIPALHRNGFPGVLARLEADRRYGRMLKGESVDV